MNRNYTRERYLELMNEIKTKIPDVSITTDIIIGFPGETEEEFEDTLALVKEVEYDSAFTFLYSIRQGTPAAKFEDQVDEETKHRRFNILIDEVNKIIAEKNKKYEGRTVEVLVDGLSKNDDTKVSGRTRNGRLVNFEGSADLIGKLVNVEITKAQSFSLVGKIVE